MRFTFDNNINIRFVYESLELISFDKIDAMPEDFYRYITILDLCPEEVVKALHDKDTVVYNDIIISYRINQLLYLRFDMRNKSKSYIHAMKQAVKYMYRHRHNINPANVHDVFDDFLTRNYTVPDEWIEYVDGLKTTWDINKRYLKIAYDNNVYFYALLDRIRGFCVAIKDGKDVSTPLSDEDYPLLRSGENVNKHDHEAIIQYLSSLSPTSRGLFDNMPNFEHGTSIEYRNDQEINELYDAIQKTMAKWNDVEVIPEWLMNALYQDMMGDYNASEAYGLFYYVHPKYYANTDILNELLGRYHIFNRYNKITSLVRDAIHEVEDYYGDVNFDKLLEYIAYAVNSYYE